MNRHKPFTAALVCSAALFITPVFAAGGGHGGPGGVGGFGGGGMGSVGGVRTMTSRSIASINNTVVTAGKQTDATGKAGSSLGVSTPTISKNGIVMVPMMVTGSRLPQLVPVRVNTAGITAPAADVKVPATKLTQSDSAGVKVGKGFRAATRVGLTRAGAVSVGLHDSKKGIGLRHGVRLSSTNSKGSGKHSPSKSASLTGSLNATLHP